ncbi:MAG TPA: D-alanine--D-alanine ligase [Fervidobacterium sp.]|nr:D-alanine--D-alanine ligase [Fervidobacterium sp.]HQG01582.1 D-alanine--D-alanine ligase [Fervidobacterium sp.]HQI09218.1 D-alanine--D-alanine ligase [Fervidobacterium sp.]HQI92967.1 D-alanine--D-alanine ligase [Fervidobacterium sp.]
MKIAVLMGGISKEREISLRSGKRIAQALRESGHNVDEIDVSYDTIYEIGKLKGYDALFNILHGTFGEDGRMQAILDAIRVPYTGSGVETSVIAFDKYLCNLLVDDLVDIPAYTLVSKDDYQDYQEGIINFEIPCVIKPRREGSSIGIHICHSIDEVESALKTEFEIYDELMIQRYIKGIEITISVIDIDSNPIVLPILELRPKKEFYDYEAKYTDGLTEFIIPAQIGEDMTRKIEKIALDIYRKLGCRHFARIDGIVSGDKFYFLEVNTLPGMTDLSDLPMSAKVYGMSFEELVNNIVLQAYRDFHSKIGV